MSIDKYLGNWLGLDDGIHSIGSGEAALIGLVVVAFGWIISFRQQREKIRIESARSTLMVENEKFQKFIKVVSPYFHARRQFPTIIELRKKPNKELGEAIHEILTLLEILSLDIATGRASEWYVREAQRSMFCTIAICSQDYVNSIRAEHNVKRLYHNLEIAFIRLYFNRYACLQWFIEMILGRPSFKYSYLMFRMRYLIAGPLFGLSWNYREESWPKIKVHFRAMRRVKEALIAGAALLLIAFIESQFI